MNTDPIGQVHGSLGQVTYHVRGQVFGRSSHIPTMWHVQDPLAIANAMGDADRAQLDGLIERVHGSEFMSLTLDRPIARENNVYVVGS